jgi:glutathione S-transferase
MKRMMGQRAEKRPVIELFRIKVPAVDYRWVTTRPTSRTTQSIAGVSLMITVHHLRASQSERIVWLCEELGIPYELKTYAREPNGAAPATYKALHPQATAPIITDGTFALAETGAIVDFILARHGGGRLVVGPQASNFPDYLYWLHFGNGFFVPAAMMAIVASRMAGDDKQAAQGFTGRHELAFRLSEERLGKVPYFAGPDFTAADIMMVFPLTTMRASTGRGIGDSPNLRAYLGRIGERPGYQRAMKLADPEMQPGLE